MASRWAAAVLAVASTLGTARAESLPFYPLVQGLYWVYEGKVQWGLGAAPSHAAPITWKSEIIGIVRGADFVAARFRGLPFDLSDYQPGLKPEDAVVVEVRGQGVFVASGTVVPRLWREIKGGGASGAGFLRVRDAFAPLFPYPLAPTDPAAVAAAKALGGTMQTVSAPVPFDASRIAGSPLKRGDKAEEYFVGFSARREQTGFGFVPRLGIVSYDDHTGPVRASVRLVRIGSEKIGD